MVDGLGVGDVGNVVLRDLKHLRNGLVIIVATVDNKTGVKVPWRGPDEEAAALSVMREQREEG